MYSISTASGCESSNGSIFNGIRGCFTNPAAREWFAGHITQLLDMGVDAIKTDFGERIPTDGVAYHDGSDPVKMHNFYPIIYNETVFRAIEARRGRGEAVLFARSSYASARTSSFFADSAMIFCAASAGTSS